MITKPLGVTASARGGLDDCIRSSKKKYITFFLFFFYSCRPDIDDNDSDHDIDELTRILNVFDTNHRRPRRREAPIQKAICARSYLGATRLFIPLRATIDTDIS
ncbi:hypothetical protein PNOK_0476100 [Pyrrhoderma noxium]|uniref:Uncharacterized protein n=1 Tax=Pyrrhoderma noxium TaxID=2282107 RepID=A0A286UJQ4_9AGAM|nr:hypothetical protein PNOK_0476100 [Pyrrhoderma noxium]